MKTINARGRSIQVVNYFKNIGELSDKLKGFSYRVLKEDCLDLPDKIYIKRNVSLTAEQSKLYEQMKTTALAILNGKQVTSMTVLTQLMRLHQITCGHFTADDGSTQQIKNNRITELMDVLEEIEGKAIIWANYQHDISEIKKNISKEYGEESVVDYYGLTPQEDRQNNIQRFQNDPECRFILGTPQTGGYGKKKAVTYVDLMAEKTVDEKIVKALRKKINIASEVLGEELRDWI
jgi:SNF2 family DNA or RNA helicase